MIKRPNLNINLFFALLKINTLKKVRCFRFPISSNIVILVKLMQQMGFIYQYQIELCGSSIVIFPRFCYRFKNFQAKLTGRNKILSVKVLNQYLQSGYEFLAYSNDFPGQRFFSSNDFRFEKRSGILLAIWLYKFTNFLNFKSFFFRS